MNRSTKYSNYINPHCTLHLDKVYISSTGSFMQLSKDFVGKKYWYIEVSCL